MLSERESIGAIVLRRTEVHPFTEKQIKLLQTFADQAVIAIGNVRMFEQVQERTKELSRSLDDLRTAQDRLIQTEKLASLGQLTAGIAHEIKNPLNFVNNFSALSMELVDELHDVLKPTALDNKTREGTNELTQMLKANLESYSMESAPTRSSRTCCCTRARARANAGLSTSTRWSRRASILPIMARALRARNSKSGWTRTSIRRLARSICSRRRLRGYFST